MATNDKHHEQTIIKRGGGKHDHDEHGGAWKVAFADSEELDAENGSANNVFDLQPTTFWHTAYSGGAPGMPHRLVIDLGRTVDLSGIRVLPRQEGVNGRIKGYRIFLSETPFKGQ